MINLSYEEIPYPSLAYAQSRPDRLAAVATLLGLSPPPVSHCRVLELGCASGGNLIPLAHVFPNSHFVGIDGSARQIAEGQMTIADLALDNIQLQQQDIMAITADLGQFDYIIAHGVYSWVPEAVRDKLLAVCRQNLAPDGVAYVSYNTYPGWHLMDGIRHMLRYHTRRTPSPPEKLRLARELLTFMTDSLPAGDTAYSSFLHAYAGSLNLKLVETDSHQESLLLHDELEEVNTPVYFHSFMEHAARYGLQYLAEAEFSSAMPGNFPAATVQQLQQMAGNTIEYEQYLDFLRNRTFRQTLLVHQETAVTRALRPDPVSRLYIMTHAGPTEVDLDLASPAVGRFEAPNGAIFASDHPLTKAAYLHLAENRPYAYAFDELVAAARQRLPAPGESGDDTHEQQILAANLLRAYAYSSRLLEFSTTPPAYVATVSDRPAASRLAAWQAERQTRVTNMRHERVMLDDLSRYLLPRLNGRRNRETLWAELQQAGGAGQITLESKEVGNGPRQFTTAALQEELDDHLAWLAYSALLIG